MDNNHYTYTLGGVLKYDTKPQHKSHKKRLFIILSVVALLIIVAGVLIWFFYLNPQWKIYKNEEYGFTMKYPAGWDYYLIENNDVMFTMSGDIMFAPKDIINSFKEIPGSVNGKSLTFTFRGYGKYEYEDFIQPILSASDEYGDVTTNDIAIDGISGKEYISKALVEFPGISKGDLVVDHVIPYGNGYLNFSLFDYRQINIFKKMMDSVRLSNKSGLSMQNTHDL